MAKNYFAIVHKETGKMPVLSAELPIFWYKKTAEYKAKRYKDHIVQPVDISDMERLILTQPNKKAV